MTPFHIRRDDSQTGANGPHRSTTRLDMHDIYEQMIEHELRAGRLTPARRKRIVRYAAGLGLSAVEAGKLVDACHAKLAREQGLPDPRPKLRLADVPPAHDAPARVAAIWKIGAVVLLAVIVDLMVLGLLRP